MEHRLLPANLLSAQQETSWERERRLIMDFALWFYAEGEQINAEFIIAYMLSSKCALLKINTRRVLCAVQEENMRTNDGNNIRNLLMLERQDKIIS